ncbi:hypothetical protein [Symbiopectobacterium sp. RP]
MAFSNQYSFYLLETQKCVKIAAALDAPFFPAHHYPQHNDAKKALLHIL